jgi:glycosyltransferase involved in cell wall biosynthesis
MTGALITRFFGRRSQTSGADYTESNFITGLTISSNHRGSCRRAVLVRFPLSKNCALKVLVAHPSTELYGTDRILLESVDGFLEQGWEVVVVLVGPGPLVAELERRSVAIKYCQTPVLRKSLMSLRGIVELFGRVIGGLAAGLSLIRRERPHVVYVSTITIPLWSLLAVLRRIPHVIHVHEAEGSASKLVQTVLAAPLLLATSIVANSEFSAAIHQKVVPQIRKKTKVIYNGVASTRPEAPRQFIGATLKVLYVGRLSHRKGVDVAVAAIRQLRDSGIEAVLDIVGNVYPGYEWYETELREQVVSLGLEDVVSFHGFQSDADRFRRSCDVVVVTSRLDEPFGNTAVEAVLAQRPLVVSDTSGLKEAASGYETAILVQPGDPSDLARALRQVHDRWPSLTAQVALSADQAEAKHGPPVYRAAIADELEKLLSRP